MPWDVQPYRWLTELRDNYTRTVIGAVRKDAFKLTEQIEEWMWVNAPWEDKTGDARASLTAEMRGLSDPKIIALMNKQLRAAQRADQTLLRSMNKERRSSGKIPLSKVPTGRSAVAELTRQRKADAPPIIWIDLYYEGDIPYAIWLEIANQGRYSIIGRTLDHWSPILMRSVQRNANLINSRMLVANEIESPQDAFAKHVEKQNEERRKRGLKSPYTPWSEEVKNERAYRREQRRTLPARKEAGTAKSRKPSRPMDVQSNKKLSLREQLELIEKHEADMRRQERERTEQLMRGRGVQRRR